MRSEVAQTTGVGQNFPPLETLRLVLRGEPQSLKGKTLRYPSALTLGLLRRLVESARIRREQHECARAGKKWRTPTPAPQDYLRILLIIKTRRKKADFYPTICMIISGLARNSQNDPIYFHRDKLWINPKDRNFVRRTHDIFNSKGVKSKIRETPPLYSIRYREENSDSGAQWCPEPTISMNLEVVSVFKRKASCS